MVGRGPSDHPNLGRGKTYTCRWHLFSWNHGIYHHHMFVWYNNNFVTQKGQKQKEGLTNVKKAALMGGIFNEFGNCTNGKWWFVSNSPIIILSLCI